MKKRNGLQRRMRRSAHKVELLHSCANVKMDLPAMQAYSLH